jgi:heterodisulfide reductase subunit D
MCRYMSPHFRVTRLESCTPKGYAILLAEIAEGVRTWNRGVSDKFYQNTLGGECRNDCMFHWPEDDMVRNAREEIVKQQMEPEGMRTLRENLLANCSLYRTVPEWNVDPGRIGRRGADVLYVAGGSTRSERPEVAAAAVSLLQTAGVDWMVCTAEGSTGMELYDLGYVDDARKQARTFAKAVDELSPKTLVLASGNAYRAVTGLFASWGVGLSGSCTVLHSSQFVEQILPGLPMRTYGGKERIGYLDSAYLGRKAGVFDSPRRVIRRVTGSDPAEFYASREAAPSSGAGTSMYLTHPDLSRSIAKLVLDQAVELGMQVVITACPADKTSLQQAADHYASSVRIRELGEFVALHVDQDHVDQDYEEPR